MMKNYTNLSKLIILMVLLSGKAWGQLTGNYTIDNTLPASATNFTTFADFAAALNSQGVATGGATVDVNGQSVYTERVNITQASMTSANALVINGNGRTLTFGSSTSALPYTFMLSGADYVTVNNLRIEATNSSNAWAVHLWNGADYNTFNTCTITCQNNVTASSAVPVSISNSGTSLTSSGNSGNYNTWDGCVISGGYYGVQMYGWSSSPYSMGNKIINGQILDFYYMGVYMYGYQVDFEVRNNVFERLNRTNAISPCYGVYLSTSPLRNKIEKNHFRRFYDNMTNTTAGFVGVRVAASATSGNEVLIRNNVISDITSNGYIYAIYSPGYSNVFIEHNTISIDDQSGANTSGNTVYGIYTSTGPGRILNNLISITRSGSGTKYGLYYGTVATFTSNGNVVYHTNNANFGYFTAARANLAAWIANSPYGDDASEADPIFTNPGAMNYVPTNTVINNIGAPAGAIDDIANVVRSQAFPDPGAYEMYTLPCVGAPTGTVTGPTQAICPGMKVNLKLPVNGLLFSGYTLQWQASTLAIAGFTSVPGATVATQGFSPPETTYYTALITCTNNSSSAPAVPLGINVIAPSNSVVPYKESFETLAANQLPNCGWSASSLDGGVASGNTITYTTSSTNGRYPRTGKNFASFYYSPAGQHYFYTNGIQLQAGITYSASLWYITEATGATNFSDLSILLGTGQTSSSQTQTIVSSNGPAQSVIYKQLSDTFRVSSSGIYYVSIRATSIAGAAQYLSWDDLEITIPCDYNRPPMVIGSTAQSSVCSGQLITLNVAGAASYTWNTGQNGSSISAIAPTVLNPTPYDFSVTGLNALSGCLGMVSHNFIVNPSPVVLAVADNPAVCPGKSVMLTALGANTYAWAHGAYGSPTNVSPSGNTTYSVTGANSYGCTGTGTVGVILNQSPSIFATANSTEICVGEDLQLDAVGGTSYNWISSTGGVYSGPTVIIRPTTSAVFTVTGMDAQGCTNTANLTIAVNACTGLSENTFAGLQVFPNPIVDFLNIKFSDNKSYALSLYDVNGRIVHSGNVSGDGTGLNLSGLDAGVYTLMVSNDQASKSFKIVKVN